MNELQQRDLKYIWHPCSQMRDYEIFPPLPIKSAKGSYLYLNSGEKIIDAISSWWCKSLGHGNEGLKQAMLQQLDRFEHVITANTTNEQMVRLSEQLGSLMPGLTKVFYAGDGSSIIEVAMKMSLHCRVLQGDAKKTRFIALKNGYHGETCGAMSVSDLGIYRDPYKAMLFSPTLIEPLYVSGISDPKWNDASEHWQNILPNLERTVEELTAIIIEPIVQGAGGMRVYSQDFLSRLSAFAKANNIHLIADEIMTGIGRTGKMLACEYAKITPDFICLSKGLTSGFMPFSALLTSDEIYNEFYADYKLGKSFLHSHTYSGNALGVSLALATLNVIRREKLVARANYLNAMMLGAMRDIANNTGMLVNIRGIGAIMAADLVNVKNVDRFGFKVYQKAVSNGVLLRPLGNTIYWLPPLNITEVDLHQLFIATQETLVDFK